MLGGRSPRAPPVHILAHAARVATAVSRGSRRGGTGEGRRGVAAANGSRESTVLVQRRSSAR